MYLLPEWLPVLTKDGIKQLKDINVSEEIWSETGWNKVTVLDKDTKTSQLYKFRTGIGSVYCNDKQKVLCQGDVSGITNACSIDSCKGQIVHPDNDVDCLCNGLVFGGGVVVKDTNGGRVSIIKSGSTRNFELLQDDNQLIKSNIVDVASHREDGHGYILKTNLNLSDVNTSSRDRYLPDWLITSSPEKVSSFLKGFLSISSYCYSLNGIFKIAITIDSKVMAEQIQMLLSSIGFTSILINKKINTLPFKQYNDCLSNYKLEIVHGASDFIEEVGFIQKGKVEDARTKIKKCANEGLEFTSGITLDTTTVSSGEQLYHLRLENNNCFFWSCGCGIYCSL